MLLLSYTKKCILRKYTVDILEKLKCDNKNIFLVSNVTGPIDIYNEQIKEYGISRYFKNVFWSSAIGFRKPSIKFMEYILEKTKVKINESVFIGDSEIADVGAANVVGMDAVLITEIKTETKAKYTFSYKELFESICGK